MSKGINALTIDVEDYFQIYAFSKSVRFKDWPLYECRVERNTNKILNILAEWGVRGTFFILGWVAEKYPQLVREIAEQGHEIASHGYSHELVRNQTPEEFRLDVAKTKEILENVTGREILGYRASTYSITKETSWALRILAEEGYRYDSSIFPVLHDVYGFPEAPRFPFRVNFNDMQKYSKSLSLLKGREWDEGHDFWEFPVSTVRFLGRNIPVSGGGYFRLFPYWFIKKSLSSINETEKRPFVFYLHPWEFDPEQPRVKGVPLKSKFRTYLNLQKVECRFGKLLHDFKFDTMAELMREIKVLSLCDKVVRF